MGPQGGRPPFDARELEGADGLTEDIVETTRMARELEVFADRSGAAPTRDFTKRVMAAVAVEPVPAPVRAAGTALRAGSLGAFLASLRDAWRVATGGGFPVAVRAQAFALVLVVVGVVTGSSLAAAGAAGLLAGDNAAPSPPAVVTTPLPTIAPASLEPGPSTTAEPTESVEPSPSPEPSTEPTHTAEPTDTADGEGGGGETSTVKPTKAPATPTPTRTHEPEDDGGSATDAPETQEPDSTQEPQGTAEPTGSPDS
jgi:hypothetical protein